MPLPTLEVIAVASRCRRSAPNAKMTPHIRTASHSGGTDHKLNFVAFLVDHNGMLHDI